MINFYTLEPGTLITYAAGDETGVATFLRIDYARLENNRCFPIVIGNMTDVIGRDGLPRRISQDVEGLLNPQEITGIIDI